jgi:hypothetical protein
MHLADLNFVWRVDFHICVFVDSSDADKKTFDEAEGPPKAVVKPEDALPEQNCLRALAALRHTKFFQVSLSPDLFFNIGESRTTFILIAYCSVKALHTMCNAFLSVRQGTEVFCLIYKIYIDRN